MGKGVTSNPPQPFGVLVPCGVSILPGRRCALGLLQELSRHLDDLSLVRESERGQGLLECKPLGGLVFTIMQGGVPAYRLHEIEGDRFEVSLAPNGEPVLNLVQGADQAHEQACLFLSLSQRGLLARLISMGCTLGKLPPGGRPLADEGNLDCIISSAINYAAGREVMNDLS